LLADLGEGIESVEGRVIARIAPRVENSGAQSWQQVLLSPLQEHLLTPADKILATAEEVHLTFENSLKAPLQEALQQRAALRERLAAFRAEHNL